MLKHFWKYYWQADTIYSIHSPFVFGLLQEVLAWDKTYYSFPKIEQLRYLLSLDKNKIKVQDLGAGSKVNTSESRTVSSIVRHTISPAWQCQFLFRLINHLQLKNRLELGTSLGINSLYQYFPYPNDLFYTVEGCPATAQIAQRNFAKIKATNIQMEVGDFETLLPKVLEKMPSVDYVFFDGNHQKEATLQYFNQCLPYHHANSVFVFDDIYWSDEMAAAWQAIKQTKAVTLTLDFFYFGLVFFRQEQQQQQHFSIIPTKYKPWQVALF